MDKKQAQNIVVDTLQNSFDKERFLYFVKNFLNSIDDSKAFHARGYVKDSFKKETGIIKTYERLGTYTDPEGKKIDILVVYLQKPKSIDKARTAQRDFVAHYLKDRNQKDAGLVAFVSPDPADWRFSLVKMEYKFEEGKSGRIKVKEEFTPAKRWSFLVGAHENSHTAQSRLAPIVEDDSDNPTLSQIEEAFNIEKVTKEFFEKYRELFFKASESLGEIVKKDKTVYDNFWEISGASKKEDAERFIGNFVKKLLGQIVFLYFLQKKGWFGVPMSKNWGDGDKKFLRTLFEEAQEKGKNYFNDYLEPLFYEALAKERDDDYYSRFNCKIPFLNGGLFDPISDYDWVNTAINLPDELFSNDNLTKEKDRGDGILDIFDRYNFTVKEDEPLEKEVAVDPEMLGKVFENLLEVKDRKSKGTYYTPREIVHYMCQESLINYLKTETKVDENRIRQLVNQDIFLTKKDVEKGKNKVMVLWEGEHDDLDKALKGIKIVDPACGSGAFLVGMLQEIVKARKMLQAFNGKRKSEYLLREETIQNCIYGVDIDPGATEIAKLRLWLSLIVEEDDIKDIKPLPNLDYKIMQGNSLLEEFEGVKLFDEEFIAGVDTGKEKRIDDLKKRQNELSSEYIKLHQAGKLTDAKKAEIDAELKNIMKELKKLSEPKKESNNSGLFDASDEAKEKAERLKQLHKEFFETTRKKKKDELKKQIEKLEWELIEATLKKEGKTSALKKLEEFKKSNTKPFFLWKLNFAEVFQEKNGFDIVIANPPYVEFKKIPKEEKEDLEGAYISAKGKYDLYIPFIELAGEKLLDSGGTATFICPTRFIKRNYGKELRRLLANNYILNEIIDFADLQIFSEAITYTGILSYSKRNGDFVLKYKKFKNNRKVTADVLSNLLKAKETSAFLEVIDKNGNELNEDSWEFNNKIVSSILKKIKDESATLRDISEGIYQGISTGKDEVFVLNKSDVEKYKIEDDILQPFLKGKDIGRYSLKYNNLYLIYPYDKNGKVFDEGYITKEYPNAYAYLKFKKNILGGRKYFEKSNKRWYELWNQRSLDRFDQMKIITLDNASRNSFCLDEYGYLTSTTGYSIILKNKNKLYYLAILGILNSSLLEFIHKKTTVPQSGGFYRYQATFIENLPIKNIDNESMKEISENVNKILEMKKSKNNKNNSKYRLEVINSEKEINEIVYRLYGMTKDEIKIVEGK